MGPKESSRRRGDSHVAALPPSEPSLHWNSRGVTGKLPPGAVFLHPHILCWGHYQCQDKVVEIWQKKYHRLGNPGQVLFLLWSPGPLHTRWYARRRGMDGTQAPLHTWKPQSPTQLGWLWARMPMGLYQNSFSSKDENPSPLTLSTGDRLVPFAGADTGVVHRMWSLCLEVRVCSAPCPPPSPSFVMTCLPLFGVLSLTCPRGDRLSPGGKILGNVATVALGLATLPEWVSST